MICNWCKREVKENSQFCTYCGKELTNTNNYVEQNTTNFNNQTEEKANIGLAILSWFIPLAGLIIFIVKKDKEPKTAKVSGICALISFILNLIVIGVATFIIHSAVQSIFSNTIGDYDYNYDYDYEEDYDYNYDYGYEDEDESVTNDNNDTNTSSTSTDWKKYEFTVNNKTLTLPTTYDELTNATGFNYKSSLLKSYLQSDYYVTANMYKNDKLALYTEILNDSEEDKLYTDCKITRVSQSEYQVSNGADVITFPGGLKAGDKITEDEIIKLFGTPDDTSEYSSTGYESKTYKYTESTLYTTTNNFIISVVNGTIDQIQLDNR